MGSTAARWSKVGCVRGLSLSAAHVADFGRDQRLVVGQADALAQTSGPARTTARRRGPSATPSAGSLLADDQAHEARPLIVVLRIRIRDA